MYPTDRPAEADIQHAPPFAARVVQRLARGRRRTQTPRCRCPGRPRPACLAGSSRPVRRDASASTAAAARRETGGRRSRG